MIYVTSYAQSTFRHRGNTLFRSQAGNQYYFEGRPAPALSNRTDTQAWASVAIAAIAATVSNGQNITSVVPYVGASTPGFWQVNFAFNFESTTCPVFITPMAAGAPLLFSYSWNGAGSIRIRFRNDAGAAVDPDGFSIMVLGERALN